MAKATLDASGTTTSTQGDSSQEVGGGNASLEARLAALEARATAAEAKVAAQATEMEEMESGYATIVSAFRPDAPEETKAHVFQHLLADAGHSPEEITQYLTAQEAPGTPPAKVGGGKEPQMNPEIEQLKRDLAASNARAKAAEEAATQRQAYENRHLLGKGVGEALGKSASYAKIQKALGENAPKNFQDLLRKEVEGATVSALRERLRSSGQQVLDPQWVEEEATKAAESVAGKFASIVDAAHATSKVGAGSADADDLETLLAQKPVALPDHKKVPVGQGEKAVDDYLGMGMVQDLAAAKAEQQGGLIGG